MTEEIKGLLEEMKAGLEGKSAEQVEKEVKAFEAKYDAIIEEKAKELNVTIEEVKAENQELKSNLEALQAHADKLDIKMQENKQTVEKKVGDVVANMITKNFDEIKTVVDGRKINLKAVGNMTLGNNLTGDQPRDYSMDVAAVPAQLVNVADLIGSVQISGGVYTFPREGAGEGSIAAQTEGSDKSQRDYDFTMVDVTTDFIAGYCVYSKKMANNLPFLESFLPGALRRDYWKAENTAFNTVLAAGVTASSELAASHDTYAEQLLKEIATLEAANFAPNVIVVTPADWYKMLSQEKSTGAGYGFPGLVSVMDGKISLNGIPVVKANWLAANKYYVGDFSRIKKVITEGLGLAFSEHDEDNFRKNNISARIEAQVGLAIERIDAVIYGDFTAA